MTAEAPRVTRSPLERLVFAVAAVLCFGALYALGWEQFLEAIRYPKNFAVLAPFVLGLIASAWGLVTPARGPGTPVLSLVLGAFVILAVGAFLLLRGMGTPFAH